MINLPAELAAAVVDDDIAVDVLDGMDKDEPVMFWSVNRGEKYVTEIEVFRESQPLMPRKYADFADGPID